MNHQGYQPIDAGTMPPPPASTWHEWKGEPKSGPYISPNLNVEVEFRTGQRITSLMGYLQWDQHETAGDIVRYRLAEQLDSEASAFRPDQIIQKSTDTISHPSHYTNGKVEAIDAIEAATTGLEGIEAVCTGNVLKYIWRWKLKNGIEDLKKARWYLDRLIAKVEKDA